MQGYLHNNRGIALLTVMMLMGVCLVVITMFFYFASSESRMTYRYGDDSRSLHVAEAGADLAINEWIRFINSRHDQLPSPALGSSININAYKSQLTIAKGTLESKLRSQDYFDTNNVYINYTKFSPSSSLSTDTKLIVDIEGEYNGEVYPYQVKLSFSADGNTLTYKGY